MVQDLQESRNRIVGSTLLVGLGLIAEEEGKGMGRRRRRRRGQREEKGKEAAEAPLGAYFLPVKYGGRRLAPSLVLVLPTYDDPNPMDVTRKKKHLFIYPFSFTRVPKLH